MVFIDFFCLLSLCQKDFGIDIWAIFLFFLKVISDLSVLSILYCQHVNMSLNFEKIPVSPVRNVCRRNISVLLYRTGKENRNIALTLLEVS